MKTLIMPCAGRSTRFPGLRPKYLLTHPNGELMVCKSLAGILHNEFDRIIITIVREHVMQYNADLWIKQATKDILPGVEICILDDFTSCASETVYKTIKQMNVCGSFVSKDSDNYYEVNLHSIGRNFVVGLDVRGTDITNLHNKSFIITNEQQMILRIEEKSLCSNIISLGCYGFESADDFAKAYIKLSSKLVEGEIYISHVIQFLIALGKAFICEFTHNFHDFGTIEEWLKISNKMQTIFIDFDGILIRNSGRYGNLNWDNNNEYLETNMIALAKLHNDGAQIVITTARPECYRDFIASALARYGIKAHAIVTGLNHSPRLLINDFSASNPWPSARAVSMPRDGNLSEYIYR